MLGCRCSTVLSLKFNEHLGQGREKLVGGWIFSHDPQGVVGFSVRAAHGACFADGRPFVEAFAAKGVIAVRKDDFNCVFHANHAFRVVFVSLV